MPDTSFYYYAAYVVLGALYGGYVYSLWRRGRGGERPPRQ